MRDNSLRVYIGNIPFKATEDDIRGFFDANLDFQPVDVSIITDRDTGRSKGFGFATFQTEADLERALQCNGRDMGGRELTINKARDKEQRSNDSRRDYRR